MATAPRQLWCWDLTLLQSQIVGQWFYLHVILDVYSREIVDFEVHERDRFDHAVALLRRTALTEGVDALSEKPILHGDDGPMVKGTTVLAMLHWLGIKSWYTRPGVSGDNAFIEVFFSTTKYRSQYPTKGFADLNAVRCWVREFVAWYNHDHRQRHPLRESSRASFRSGSRHLGPRTLALYPGP